MGDQAHDRSGETVLEGQNHQEALSSNSRNPREIGDQSSHLCKWLQPRKH